MHRRAWCWWVVLCGAGSAEVQNNSKLQEVGLPLYSSYWPADRFSSDKEHQRASEHQRQRWL